MATLNIPHYIADYLPEFITDYLSHYTTDQLQKYVKDQLPDYIKDYLPHSIPDCATILDTIQNQCVPLSSVATAIFIYSIIALLLSW
jgi:hypothetical protein